MDLTYSEQFKKYIKEQNYLGYPQTIYKFPNGYGASVIKLNYIYFGIEIAVLRFDEMVIGTLITAHQLQTM